jgi:hypothetical protein
VLLNRDTAEGIANGSITLVLRRAHLYRERACLWATRRDFSGLYARSLDRENRSITRRVGSSRRESAFGRDEPATLTANR